MTREDELYVDELRDRAYSDYERLDLAINELERQTNTRSQRKVRNQMKIMIDIDKDVYTRLFDKGIQDNEIATDDICEMARAIRLGTPLEAQPCEDCISREAVLGHICEDKECYKEECKGRTLKRCPDLQWVFDLPSVTPRTNLAETSQDCISREAVQDLISSWLSDYLLDETREALETINYKVGDMPSVTPQRPKGKWISVNDNDSHGWGAYKSHVCSECKGYYTTSAYEMKYCPNCGAEMSGGGEE